MRHNTQPPLYDILDRFVTVEKHCGVPSSIVAELLVWRPAGTPLLLSLSGARQRWDLPGEIKIDKSPPPSRQTAPAITSCFLFFFFPSPHRLIRITVLHLMPSTWGLWGRWEVGGEQRDCGSIIRQFNTAPPSPE